MLDFILLPGAAILHHFECPAVLKCCASPSVIPVTFIQYFSASGRKYGSIALVYDSFMPFLFPAVKT